MSRQRFHHFLFVHQWMRAPLGRCFLTGPNLYHICRWLSSGVGGIIRRTAHQCNSRNHSLLEFKKSSNTTVGILKIITPFRQALSGGCPVHTAVFAGSAIPVYGSGFHFREAHHRRLAHHHVKFIVPSPTSATARTRMSFPRTPGCAPPDGLAADTDVDGFAPYLHQEESAWARGQGSLVAGF